VVLHLTPSLAVKTLRSRGAAAAPSLLHARAASAAELCRARAASASDRSIESSFPRRQRRIARTAARSWFVNVSGL
jgi:hypothetical protein